MQRAVLLSAILAPIAALAIAGPAQAGERCNQPYAPVIKVDASTTQQQLVTLRGDVTAFIAASDIYQKCLLATNPGSAKLQANQAAKERVGREFNALVKSFKVASKS